jgi:hypothetical protein
VKNVWAAIGIVLFLGAITAFDWFIDLPEALGMPELFDCIEHEEIATGEKNRGFQFCP